MLAVFLALFVLGLAAAATLQTRFEARSSVLVRLGPEYVYEPSVGEAGRGAAPTMGEILKAEAEIMRSAPLRLRALERLGLARTYPELAAGYARGSQAQKQAIMARAAQAIERGLVVDAGPETMVVRLGFRHRDPQAAALILNTLIEEYLVYRSSVLSDPASSGLERQRQALEGRLAQADAAYADFLAANQLGDFTSERTALAQLQAQVQQRQFEASAQLQDREGRLEALSAQMQQVAPEIGLYRDLPATGAGGAGRRRIGVNPVHQALQVEKIQLAAEIAALKRSQVELAAQARQVTVQRLRLAALDPQFAELSLDREVLQSAIRDLAVKAEHSRTAREMSARSSDNIRILQRATPPTEGSSLRRPVIVLSFLAALFAALSAGVLAAILRPGLPTPASAGRTLGLPVLGSATLKGR